MNFTSRTRRALLLAATVLIPSGFAAQAQTAAPAPPSAQAKWSDAIVFGLQFEGGIIGNAASPKNGINFGHSFTDKSNDFQFNQVLATMARPLDPKATGYDFGFKLQAMGGTDARYTRWTNFGQGQSGTRFQGDIIEANVLLHTPWLTEGGIDFKAGMYSTPMGAETIDPSTNSFYSKSYIFNFGLPFKHTGVLATAHVTPIVDLYAGVDSGVNTLLGNGIGDNNGTAAIMAGIGLNLMGGDLTILALTHIGPENPSKGPGGVAEANKHNREFADIVVTWKATGSLTTITELNFVHDDNPNITTFDGSSAKGASAWGIAQYLGYSLTDELTLNARAEVFADSKNFFVGAFPGNNAFNDVQTGKALTNAFGVPGNSGTTYGAITLGATYKPNMEFLPMAATLLIRPEVRYDTSLNGKKPYNGGKDTGAFTFGSDFVLTF